MNVAVQRQQPGQVPHRRLNLGCGRYPEPGWINCDITDEPGIDIRCDIRERIPLDSDSIDYIVAIHVLPEIPYFDLVKSLMQIRRVLRPGGVLRLALPDFDKGIRAYQAGDKDYFLVPDEEVKSLSSKFIVQMIWYGYSRSLFTFDFTKEILWKAGFDHVTECKFKQTASAFPDITTLDNRERESLFVEAVK